MHSFIIISQPDKSLELASSMAPYKISKDLDTFFVDTDENIGIDTVREIKKFLQVKPYENSHKIIYIHQADLLTPQAQNSLLKTLEEPPGNTLIFLTTTNIDKLLPTVISRCQIVKSTEPLVKRGSEENSFKTVLEEVHGLSKGQRMTLASQFAYPKSKAVLFCQDAIFLFKSMLHSKPSSEIVSNLKLAHTTLVRLEANVDPRLSMEHFILNLL